MLDRIVAQIALALFKWLEGRLDRGHVGVDADLDPDRLRRAGSRLRAWLQQNGAGERGKSGEDGPRDEGKGVRPD